MDHTKKLSKFMKISLYLACLLFTAALPTAILAQNCPKLSGQYLCEDLENPERKDVLTIQEKVDDHGTVIYLLNKLTLVTDAKTYAYTDHETDEIQNAFKIGSCEDGKLHFEQWGDFVSKKGKKFGDFKILSKFSLTNDSEYLILDQVGDYYFTELGHYPINVGQECPRL
tara:strand:- start:43563 stop:44072 length:510 start_codon:yes stop_codon:yes gene_type:complete